jgi:hypothetical protein
LLTQGTTWSTEIAEIDEKNPYEVETPHYIISMRNRKEGPAVWSDGAGNIMLQKQYGCVLSLWLGSGKGRL